MKKMIEKYNDLFTNVLNEIKNNHAALVSELETTNEELTKNLGIAANYKEQINSSKELIDASEVDIKKYESDLAELKSKFNSVEFSELINVGNKEFTAKIDAKKTIITSECNKIKELSTKTQSLKELLLSLKSQKEELEKRISDITILEKYYTEKVEEMIDYTANNSEELLIVNHRIDLDLANSNDNLTESDLNLKLDDSIFDEIENISVEDIDKIDIKDMTIDLDVSEKEVDPTENLSDYLNSLINLENTIVDKASNYMIDLPINEVANTPINEPVNPVNNGFNDIFGTQMLNVVTPEQEKVLSVKPVENDLFSNFTLSSDDEEMGNTTEFNNLFGTPIEEEKTNDIFETTNVEEPTTETFDADSDINDILSNIQSDVDNEEDNLELTNEEFANIAPIDDIFSTNVQEIKVDEPVEEENKEEVSVENTVAESSFEEEMTNLGFVPSMFRPEVLSEIEATFNREEMVKYIDVLNKYDIDKAILYTDSNILLNMSADKLDHVLELLEKAGTSRNDIKRVFAKLDRVMVDKLEKQVNENNGDDIINILYSSMLYKGENDLVTELNLTAEEENKLKSIAGDEEFKVMNLFPEIVMTNYNTIKDLGVDVKECFLNHPHRFLYNTDRFDAILDKYDRDDLIRCINKNSAVIDKL